MKRILKRIGIIVAILLILGIAGFAWMAHSFRKSLEPKVYYC
jgi:hypothetical protein